MTDDRLDALRAAVAWSTGPDRTRPLVELGQALADRYWRAEPGSPAGEPYLDEAIQVMSEAYQQLEPGGLLRGQVAGLLGRLVGIRYVAHGGPEHDREQGIDMLEEALTFPQQPQTLQSMARLTLGQLLLTQVTRTLQSGDLATRAADRAVAYFQEVLDGPATDSEAISLARSMLGTAEEVRSLARGFGSRIDAVVARGLPAEQPRPTGRVVSTGLSTPTRPARNRPPTRTATPDTDYLFWLFIGDAPAPDAIDDRFVELDLPPDTRAGARITVALFAFPGEIAITDGADTGDLVLRGDGRVEVYRPPATYTGDRLLFPIRTPGIAGVHRLRCSIYCGGTLLQSRLVEIEVDERESERAAPAVRSTTDYLVDTTLDPAALATVEPVTLSVFLNDNGDGTHGFRFFGGDGTETVKADVVLGATELQDDIDRARRALRRTAWDGGGDWAEGTPFRYTRGREPDLAGDLIELARAGYRLWTTIGGRVARERQAAPGESGSRLVALQALLRSPGTIEFATKFSAGQVVPASLFYDLSLDTQHSGLTVCATAMAAIDRGADLATEPCFRGECPNRSRTVVCPGGFWGFRHRIGLPQSVRAGTVAQPPSDPPTTAAGRITFTGSPHVVVGVAKDFAGNPHPGNVAARGDAASRPVVADRTQLLDLLRTGAAPHLVYLFCHGLVSDTGLPALRVGPAGSDLISPDSLADMFWDTHPLVILNGCRTTAVEPRHAMNFVDVLIRDAAASGVVGTEIVTNEDLAASFADLLLDAWFRLDTGIGEAMRRARLGLLATGNPLGMIYVAYAAPQLRLAATR